jgi:sarcosine oxidase subunit gamma
MPDLVTTVSLELRHGRHGRAGSAPGVSLRLIASRSLITVIARKEQAQALVSAVRRAFGVDLPDKPRLARATSVSFLWSGHRQWLAMDDQRGDLLSTLRTELGSLASLSDQSDSRVILELSGSAARQTLAKLVPIDLHPRAFSAKDTALTLFGHVAGQITQIDNTPSYELTAPRSYAESFVHDLLAAGAEFGVDVLDQMRG